MAKSKNNDRFSTDDVFDMDSFMLKEDDVQESEENINFEEAANEEITQHMINIRKATANSKKSLENQWSTDFYFCAYFADQEQRDEFLKQADALGLVKDNFINGQLLAERLGIILKEKEVEVPRLFAPKRDWDDIIM